MRKLNMGPERSIDVNLFATLSQQAKLEFLVTLANLAPSSHNMQPWLFRIVNQSITVKPNFKYKLSVADLDSREFYITLGTVIGGLKLVSNAYGLMFEYQYSNDLANEIGTFSFTSLEPNNVDFEILKSFINRHNSRLPFKQEPLPQNFLENLKNKISSVGELIVVSDSIKKNEIEEIVLNSVKKAFSNKEFCNELAPWVKHSIGRHEDGLPGYNLGMPFFMSLVFPFMLRNFDISGLQVKIHKRMLDNSAVYAVICTSEENPMKWLDIGEIFMEIAVETQRSGISIGVMQASIEDREDRKELKRKLGSDKLPQMFFRLGYCDLTHNHSPRRSLNKVLVT